MTEHTSAPRGDRPAPDSSPEAPGPGRLDALAHAADPGAAAAREGLAEKLAALPGQPGVYLMKDGAGRVIYVGKAASLRARVRQYFQPGHTDSPRILHLVSKIRDVETVVCANEVEALILEATLIKRHRPWYNVRMADDKAYPYLKLTSEPYPRIMMTRRVERDGARYFGPYPYHEPKLVGRTIRLIRRLFKLRTCTLDIAHDLPRPCLDYYIGQCTAPCVAWGATAEQYAEQVRQAAGFLEGRQESLVRDLRAQMQAAADASGPRSSATRCGGSRRWPSGSGSSRRARKTATSWPWPRTATPAACRCSSSGAAA